MAEKDDVILKIKEKIAKLDKDSAKAYREQLKALNDNNAALNTYKTLLGNINDEVEDQLQGFAGLLKEIIGINEELEKEGKYVRDTTKAFRGLESIASKLKNDQKGYTDLNKDQLKQEQSKLKILHDQAKLAAEEIKKRGAQNEREAAILNGYEDQFKIFKRTNKLLEDRIKEENELNKKLGVTGVLLTGMSKIPIVGPLLKTNEALDLAREKAKAGGNAFQSMGAGLASVGKSLMSSLADPLVSIGLIVKAFQFLLNLGFKVSEQTTSLQKSFALSSDGAMALRTNFAEITKSTALTLDYQKRQLVNTTSQVEAANQLGEALGASTIPTQQQVENQIMLTKQIGLSAEEAGRLQQLAFDNNITADAITKEVIKQTKAYRNQTGIQLDNKKILQDVSKISGQLRLQYANSAQQLTAAVVQANKLGFSLEKTKQISEQLLNFEESIENELAAELLIGRDLNLEQARLLALNGKSAEATALIAENMGGSAGFASMNVIQQEALAKALGMSADELSESLLYQERLNKLGSVGQQQIAERIQQLKDEGEVDLANQLQRDVANGKSAEAALKAVSDQVLFNENIQKLKDLLGDILAGPAKGLADWIGNLRIDGQALLFGIKAIGLAIGAISISKLLTSMASLLVTTSATAAAAISYASAITLGIGVAAVIAGIVAAMGAFSSAKSEAVQPTKNNFNQGGIVGGNSLTGDNVGINVNSGEMVLTKREQAEFYNMIKRGGGMGDRNSPIIVNAMINDKVLATSMAEYGEKRNPNLLGSEKQNNGYQIQ
jgi:hypothetical protein